MVQYCKICKKSVGCLGKHLRLVHGAGNAGRYERFKRAQQEERKGEPEQHPRIESVNVLYDLFVFELMAHYNRFHVHLRQQNVPCRYIREIFITRNETLDTFKTYGNISPLLNVASNAKLPQPFENHEILYQAVKEDTNLV